MCLRGKVFIEPLLNNGHMRHNICTSIYSCRTFIPNFRGPEILGCCGNVETDPYINIYCRGVAFCPKVRNTNFIIKAGKALPYYKASYQFFSLLSLVWKKIKTGLWDHLSVCLCPRVLIRLGLGIHVPAATNTRNNRRSVGRTIFCEVRVVSKEGKRLVLPRTSCIVLHSIVI
jgi:hypothetical protein